MSSLLKSGSIVVLSVICYWVCLSGQFVFDDTEAILNNKDVMSETNLSQVWAHDFWGTAMSDKSSHKSYRPLTILAFRLLRHLSCLVLGDTSAQLFRISNLSAYIAFNLLLWSVVDRLFTLMAAHDRNRSTPFVITLVFVCHPIHSEVVSKSLKHKCSKMTKST